MPHDHDHSGMSPSGHPYQKDRDTSLSYWQIMEISVREILISKGITTPLEVQSQLDAMDRGSPADGAKVVAKAWTDPAFKARLMQDASAASAELGFDLGTLLLIAVENTQDIHNVVVCTLCSCYPRNLLGLPPDWYKSRAYRSRTVIEPRKVLAEFGVDLAKGTTVRVHDSTADMRYIVIPERPAGTENMTESDLAAIVTRDSMIGTAVVRLPNPE